MYGEYYRIKAGIVLVGGFSIDEDFNLYFTPLFHGKACGKSHKIDSIGQLVEIIRDERIVSCNRHGSFRNLLYICQMKKVCICISDESPAVERITGTFMFG